MTFPSVMGAYSLINPSFVIPFGGRKRKKKIKKRKKKKEEENENEEAKK